MVHKAKIDRTVRSNERQADGTNATDYVEGVRTRFTWKEKQPSGMPSQVKEKHWKASRNYGRLLSGS